MSVWEIIDLNGKVLKTFPSKNQATKFKKEANKHGKYGLKVIENKNHDLKPLNLKVDN